MPIWLKRAPASILIFFSLVPEVTGTVSDWERTAVPPAKSRNWSGDGGWQADCIYCEQQNQSHQHPERFGQTPTAAPLLRLRTQDESTSGDRTPGGCSQCDSTSDSVRLRL